MLKKNKTEVNRVLCMDVSLHGEYVVAGYADGTVALFEVERRKLIIEITDVHYHEIHQIKFLSLDSPITFMSGDCKGMLFKITITRTLLMYSYKSDLVMRKPFKEFCSLSALQPYDYMPREVSEWYIHNLVAFSNTEEMHVAFLGSAPRKLITITRNEFAKGYVEPGNLCYLDWGYGITPVVSRERSLCLLAVAWGNVLQIYILEDPDKGSAGFRADGYYVCDNTIDCVHFVSDSIVMILVNKKEIRILYIPHFLPKSFAYEGQKIKDQDLGPSLNKSDSLSRRRSNKYKRSPGEDSLREHSEKAELESGTTLLDGNLRYSITADRQNFNNTITRSRSTLAVLGQEKVVEAKLFHYKDYLKYVQKQCDWLVCLKIALDIYHGETKGYYGVPYVKEERERQLRHEMMDLIQEGIRFMIKNYHKDKLRTSNDYSADNIAIKAAVEFCNRINCLNFLFTGIIKLFIEEQLEDKFIENLEPFIVSGYFKSCRLPDPVLKKICDHYFSNSKFHRFERIASKLNFSHYSLYDELERICKEKMLTSALIHLIITSSPSKGNEGKACLQILSNVFRLFKQAKKNNTLDEVKEILLKDEESKYEIEASYEYIGLKLLYIIRLFIRGKQFPSDSLKPHQMPHFLLKCIEFLTSEEEATELIKLNSKMFFNVVSELYLDSFVADSIVKQNNHLNDRGEPFIPFTHPGIVDTLYERARAIQDEEHVMFEYSYFIVKVAGSQPCHENASEMVDKVYKSMSHIMK